MFLPRVLSWVVVPIGLALTACEGSTPGRTSAGAKGQPSEPPPVTTAPVDSSTPVKSEDLPMATTPEPNIASGELSADVRNANAFALKVLARAKKPSENAMVSGTSLRHALGTTFAGARGPTAREMAIALELDNDPKIAARLARAELDAWQDAKGSAELNIATRLWIDDDFSIQPDFVKTAESAFGAAPATVDYAKPDDARKTINAWVAEKTKDKIADLLPQGSLDQRTRLVVTNAIWFKGRWEFPFPKSATKDEPFKTDGKKSVTVPLMHLTDSLRVATEQGLKVLELRYAESQLSMLVVLPDDPQPSALAKLEANLTPDKLDKWTSALATARVNVTLPALRVPQRRRDEHDAAGPRDEDRVHGEGGLQRHRRSASERAPLHESGLPPDLDRGRRARHRGGRRDRRDDAHDEHDHRPGRRVPRRPSLPLPHPRCEAGPHPLRRPRHEPEVLVCRALGLGNAAPRVRSRRSRSAES